MAMWCIVLFCLGVIVEAPNNLDVGEEQKISSWQDVTVNHVPFPRTWLIANTAHLCEIDKKYGSEFPDSYGVIVEAPNNLDVREEQKISSWQEDAMDDTDTTLLQRWFLFHRKHNVLVMIQDIRLYNADTICGTGMEQFTRSKKSLNCRKMLWMTQTQLC